MANIVVNGDTSGSVTLSAPAVSGTNTLTLPAITDTLVGLAATQTLTNKTITSPVLSGTVTGTYTLGGTPSIAGSALTGTQNIPKAVLPTGSVLQVVNATYATQVTVSNTTYVDSGLTATITPTSSTSKILVLTMMHNEVDGSTNTGGNLRLYRGATLIWDGAGAGTLYNYASTGGSLQHSTQVNINYLDSPATTSATTYKIQGNCTVGTAHIMQWQSLTSTMILMEISA